MTQNTDIKITLTPELQLEQALKEAGVEDPETVTQLTVTGKLTCVENSKWITEQALKKAGVEDPETITLLTGKHYSSTELICTNDFFSYIRKKMGKTLKILNLSDIKIDLNYERSDFVNVIVFTCEKFVFADCIGLTSITLPNWIQFFDTAAFARCTSLTSIDIPDSVIEIGEWAFFGCVALTSVTIPASLKFIGYCAFYGCTGLTSVFIPPSVTEIGKDAFEGCPVYITVHPDNPVYASENGKLIEKKKLV